MAELKTDYKDQLLDSSVNTKRVYNLVDADGNVVRENVSFEDVTVYSQNGNNFGAADINKTNEEVNQLNRNFGGCALEQEGEDFFIVGADSVRKKLGSGDYNSTFVCSNNMFYNNTTYNALCTWIPNQYTDFVVSESDNTKIVCLEDGIYNAHFTYGGKFNQKGYLKVYINNELAYDIGTGASTNDGSVQTKEVTDISLSKNDIITVRFYREANYYCGIAGVSVIMYKQ